MKNIITIALILIVPMLIYSIVKNEAQETTAYAKDNNLPTMITFSSTMCLDCQKMKEVIKEIENDYKNKINFISINATEKDNNIKSMVKKYSIVLVPTMVFLDRNDKEVKRIEGAITKDELISELEELYNG